MTRRVVTRVESLPIGEEGATEAGRRAATRAAADLLTEICGERLGPEDVEITRTTGGAPRATIPRIPDRPIEISITHTRTTAYGMAAVEDADE